MGQMQSNGKPLRRILGILITTMVVALLGALLVGFLIRPETRRRASLGGMIGLYGAVRRGYVMDETNVPCLPT